LIQITNVQAGNWIKLIAHKPFGARKGVKSP
jgi:hypothetical protein